MLVNYQRLLVFIAVVILFFITKSLVNTSLLWNFNQEPDKAVLESANATLGFGAIYAVSGRPSPRRDRLVLQANLTDLEFTVPESVTLTKEDYDEFRFEAPQSIGDGALHSWMSHRNALEMFMESGAETALFMEDDVDWDIRIKSIQIPRLAAATRQVFGDSSSDHYLGNLSQWDILWIGHCGDYFIPIEDGVGVGHLTPSDLIDASPTLYSDDTLPFGFDMHPYTASQLTAFNISTKTRIIHKSRRPLCTFAYALTRTGAEKILTVVAPAKAITFAYDFALTLGCQEGIINCWTLTPELFHHYPAPSLIHQIENLDALAPVDRAGVAQRDRRKRTANLDCGFWGGNFDWESSPDREKFKEQGSQGKCLKLW